MYDTTSVVNFQWLFPFGAGPLSMHVWAEGNTLDEAAANLVAWMRERPYQELDGSPGRVVAPLLTWDADGVTGPAFDPRAAWSGDVQCTHCDAAAAVEGDDANPVPGLRCDCADAAGE